MTRKVEWVQYAQGRYMSWFEFVLSKDMRATMMVRRLRISCSEGFATIKVNGQRIPGKFLDPSDARGVAERLLSRELTEASAALKSIENKEEG